MKTLQTFIKEKIYKTAIMPVLIAEAIVIIVLFTLGTVQGINNKDIIKENAAKSFQEIAIQVSHRLNSSFARFETEANALSKMITTIFQVKHDPKVVQNYLFEDGFFIRENQQISSVYTTNITELNPMDISMLNCLSLSEIPLDAILSEYKKTIDSAWINMGSNYSLYYPSIKVQDELSSDLDPTTQSYYYEADESHNPSKKAKFIALFNEPWALGIGQIAAVVAPIYFDGAMQGVVGMTLTSENIREIGMLNLPFEAYIVISDEKGHVLYASNESELQKDFAVSSFYELHKQAKSERLKPFIPNIEEIENFVFYEEAIQSTPLKLTLIAKKSEINKELDAVYLKTRITAIVLFVLLVLFHILFFRYIANKTKSATKIVSEPITEIAELSTKLFDEKALVFKESEISELSLLNENLDKAHMKLIERLYVDSETNLGNRAKLLKDIGSDSVITLIYLENFKTINSIYGPDIASEVLLSVIDKIKAKSSFEKMTLYRVYNDIFAIKIAKKSHITKEMFTDFYQSLSLDSCRLKEFDVTLSYALSYSVSEASSELGVFAEAELALEDAKGERGSKVVMFEPEKHSAKLFEENLDWAKRLQDAIVEDRLIPHFQPIYDVKRRGVYKFESLVRMVEKDKVISPFFFLGAAAQLGKLSDITRIMINKVFKIAQFFPYVEFSINVSFEDFEDPDLIDEIKVLLKRYSIKPSNIILEILETTTFSDEKRASSVIETLKAIGFKIAIDDFGTGNSNFAHLMMMNVDYIKIDGQFIKEIASDEQSLNITKTINNFAKLTSAKSVAEFVKDEKVFRKIKLLDIDYAQGYFISEPRSAESIAEMLKIRL